MTREAFERDLRRLKDDVVQMGTRAGHAIHQAMRALRDGDAHAAAQVIADDDAIDATHLDLEERCMRLLATQQPMASDLRTIAAAFAVTIDIERMADHAEGISKATKRLAGQRLAGRLAHFPIREIPDMEGIVQEMLSDALAAFTRREHELAITMAEKDDMVDGMRSRAFRELLGIMIDDPHTVEQALELLLAVQHLERAADHITNIGERVVYMVTGELRELNV
jgi:phosphate transport system protein